MTHNDHPLRHFDRTCEACMKELPSAIYLWIVPSEQVQEQPGSWRIRKWDIEPFPEATHTAGVRPERPMLDRSEAVNLASNLRETDNIEEVTRRGIMCLVDAVLRMDQYIREARPEGTQIVPLEVRLNDDGTLDEVVGSPVLFHLEDMGENRWWMEIEQGKKRVHVWLTAKRGMRSSYSDEGDEPFAVKRFQPCEDATDGPLCKHGWDLQLECSECLKERMPKQLPQSNMEPK